jgi:predicted nuclease of restriction endonuclease-like (RecB) superfamily
MKKRDPYTIEIKRFGSDDQDIAVLLKRVKELIQAGRRVAATTVNSMQVITNFEIGRMIVEHEQQGAHRAEYGKKVLKVLSARLNPEFGRGFSERNIEYMRKFYLIWKDRVPPISQMASAKLQNAGKSQMASGQLVPKKSQIASGQSQDIPVHIAQTPSAQLAVAFPLSWSQYVFLLGIGDTAERQFYEIEAAQNSWTLPELKRQFDASLYERLALSRDKDEVRRLALEGQIVDAPKDLLKEPYVLEFLGLEEKAKYSESDLEAAIIDKLERFLLELGKGFLFEARQKRFTFDEDHFFVDLVFYNRLLRCYVLIDLKIGKLTHQDLGQMQMYVNYFDRYVKQAAEQSTIGIILCKKKRDALVELTLPKDAGIHAKEYQLYLPSKEDLKKRLMEWAEAALQGEPGER